MTLAVNLTSMGSDASIQRAAFANLGGMIVFILAGISLFYDRAVRGYGLELRVREVAQRTTDITQQLGGLAPLQVELQREIAAQNEEADGLRLKIESAQAALDRLNAENASSKAQEAEYASKLAELRQLVMDEVSRLSRCQHSIANLQSEQSELELTIQAHSDRLFEVASRHEDLNANVEQLQGERDKLRVSFEAEQVAYASESNRLRSELEELDRARADAGQSLQSLREDVEMLRELRSESQCELDMIREEYERNTAANIQSLAQLRVDIESLQSEKGRMQQSLVEVRTALDGLNRERAVLETRVEESKASKLGLDEELSSLLTQIRENQAMHESLESALQREQELLDDRRFQAEREAIEAESKQKERNRVLQELDRAMGLAVQEREVMDAEIARLSRVKDAMEISIDELTNRLESRTSELRRKGIQIQEHAERLERLSEAVQRMTAKESGSDRALPHAAGSELGTLPTFGTLPAQEGAYRGVHGAHPQGTAIGNAASSPARVSENLFEG
jgi:chromosome segregation ATPase